MFFRKSKLLCVIRDTMVLVLLASFGVRCDSQTSYFSSGNSNASTNSTASVFESGQVISLEKGEATFFPIHGVAALPTGLTCAVQANLDFFDFIRQAWITGYDYYLGGTFPFQSFPWQVDTMPFVAIGPTGACYVGGNENSTVNGKITKFKTDGSVAWTLTLTPPAGYSSTVMAGITSDLSGSVYAVGYFTKVSGFSDGFVRKYSSSGALLLNRILLATTADIRPQGLTLDQYGNLYTAGSVGTKIFVTQVSTAGVQTWIRFLRNVSFGSIAIDPLLNLTFMGYAPSVSDPDVNESVLYRYDSYGNAVWGPKIWAHPDPLRTFDSARPFIVTGSPDGAFYVNAFVKRDPTFVNPCSEDCPLLGEFVEGFSYLAKFDSSGNKVWTFGFLPTFDADSPLRSLLLDNYGQLVGYGSNEADSTTYVIRIKP